MASANKGTTKDDIIRSLLNTSFSRSAGATSMSDVATFLGIKKASLYNHISGRDQLLQEALDSCAAYIKELVFIPKDCDEICKKYSAQTVLKGVTERFFKMHERNPLFQIYTFVESLKYFNQTAREIIYAEEQSLEQQTMTMLVSLSANNKLPLTSAQTKAAARWFCNGLRTLLSDWLLERKQIVMDNPASGEGELFTLPQDEKAPLLVEQFIAEFLSLFSA
ncbi:MAG TPA: hypothetical protein DCQ43_02160 [Treponema sp.]|jgi:AcrR family transcriptional regulator|nr:hypothetical protein [Treponema sp.]HBD68689.1 hypothetical protein [Treponema sp.]